MLVNYRKLLSVFLAYALALTAFGLVSDKHGQPSLWVTAAEFTRQVTLNDPLTFLKSGVEIASNGWLLPESTWVFRLWPPGFVLLLAGLFKFFGTDVAFLALLFGLTILFGANMLLTAYCYLTEYVAGAVAFLLPLIPFLFPVTRFFLLQPLGLSLGEGFSIIFFLSAVFSLLLAVARSSIWYALNSAVFFAMSAYFRSQYELLVTALLLSGVTFWIARQGFVYFFRKELTAGKESIGVRYILIAIVGAQLLMLPWRVNNYLDTKTVSWVRTQELVARNSLMSEAELLRIDGDLVIRGGGDLACRFEPTFCNSSDTALFYKAFFQNLQKWVFYKLSLVEDFWYPSLEFFPSAAVDQALPDFWGNSIIAFLLFASFFLLFSMKKRDGILWLWILTSVYGALSVVLLLVQLEVRYFFLIKILALFSFFTFVGMIFPFFVKSRELNADSCRLRGHS